MTVFWPETASQVAEKTAWRVMTWLGPTVPTLKTCWVGLKPAGIVLVMMTPVVVKASLAATMVKVTTSQLLMGAPGPVTVTAEGWMVW